MNAPDRADAVAEALMSAAAAQRQACWEEHGDVPANALGWALKRCCDKASTSDPPATRIAAQLLEQLAARQPGGEVDALAAWARAIALLSQGQMEAALHSLDRADERFAALGRTLDVAQTRISRLMALAMLGRYDEAVQCGAAARDVFDAAGDARAAGKIELNLGTLATRRDRHDDALHHYAEARKRFASASDVELEVMATKGLADIRSRRHDFAPAEALYRQARASAEQGGLALLATMIDAELGLLALRRGRYDEALRALQRACRGYAELDVPHYLAVAEENLADAYLELNLLPEALALYERSLASYEAAGLRTDRAWALSQRGRALTLLGRHAAAAQALAQAQEAFADDGNATGAALVRLWLAELALQRGEWEPAACHCVAAEPALLAARQMSWVLHARCLHAEALHGGGDNAQAEQLARAACGAAGELHLPPARRRSLVLLGLLARERGAATEARSCFELAVESIESQRGTLPGEEFRSAFLGDKLLPYQELLRASLTAPADAAAQALHWAERSRARSLADDSDETARYAEEGDAPHREVARLRLELNDCYRELTRGDGVGDGDSDGAAAAQLLDKARRIEQLLLEAGRRSVLGTTPPAATATAAAGSGTLDLPTLHAALGGHSALIEYFSLDDGLQAIVVAAGGVNVVRLPARQDEVRLLIEQLRFQTDTLRHGAARLAHRMPELTLRALVHLQSLHAMLWAPLVPLLGRRRAVVVPHGVLHYLPFEALHDGSAHELERREFCRAPSAVLLLRCLARKRASFASALVLGHADERLPLVRAEVNAVAALFPAAQALHGDAARGAALQAADGAAADVLHIACHAQFRNDSPRFSALHLADGAFTVRDAARLRLDGTLVTLSACETGISAVMPGDELIGLTHGFIRAGAARVLASLWTVQDEAAAGFMPQLYARLRAGERPAQALRATQLAMLRTQPHPYFWSAFTLHGGW